MFGDSDGVSAGVVEAEDVALVGAIDPILILVEAVLLPTTGKLKRSKPRIRNYAAYCSKFWISLLSWVAEIEELRLKLENSLLFTFQSPIF
jgi:hypothetical protein